MREGRLFLLDACCLINLLATEHAGEILETLSYRCAVPRFVAEKEVLRFSRKSTGGEQRPISLAEIRAEIGVEILDIESPAESAELLRLGELLDEGEANACALAVGRHGGVATDDKKALALLARMTPEVPTVQTPRSFSRPSRPAAGANWKPAECSAQSAIGQASSRAVGHRISIGGTDFSEATQNKLGTRSARLLDPQREPPAPERRWRRAEVSVIAQDDQLVGHGGVAEDRFGNQRAEVGVGYRLRFAARLSGPAVGLEGTSVCGRAGDKYVGLGGRPVFQAANSQAPEIELNRGAEFRLLAGQNLVRILQGRDQGLLLRDGIAEAD